jgi:hypothetical protein
MSTGGVCGNSLGRVSCYWRRMPAGSRRQPTRINRAQPMDGRALSGREQGASSIHDQTRVKHHDTTRCSLMEVNPKTKDPAGSEAGPAVWEFGVKDGIQNCAVPPFPRISPKVFSQHPPRTRSGRNHGDTDARRQHRLGERRTRMVNSGTKPPADDTRQHARARACST